MVELELMVSKVFPDQLATLVKEGISSAHHPSVSSKETRTEVVVLADRLVLKTRENLGSLTRGGTITPSEMAARSG